ncbi:hypothetical protein BARBAKC583_0772 [Bartonella bacilliformis KC583]|uniref:Uncharacterized protein n=1 Tax=Bartonella bacilliformis (strain ATCC 35685 / KC583 / Herrer 020/F12,63) TaxID=360095 RepID=A1USW3_BARBK|nr:hypothetical protein BARBAKC583_0772 [Bartonella bacilliformis KC583]
MTWLKEYFLITLAALAAFFMALAKSLILGGKLSSTSKQSVP